MFQMNSIPSPKIDHYFIFDQSQLHAAHTELSMKYVIMNGGISPAELDAVGVPWEYYDACISKEDAEKIEDETLEILTHYYVNENEEDISGWCGLSFGEALHPCVHMLLTSYFRYHFCLLNILTLNSNCIFFYPENAPDLFKIAIMRLAKQISAEIKIFNNKGAVSVPFKLEGRALKNLPESGIRDLSVYKSMNLMEDFVELCLFIREKILFLPEENKCQYALLSTAGKLDAFCNYTQQVPSGNIRYIVPLTRQSLGRTLSRNARFSRLHSSAVTHPLLGYSLRRVKKQIIENIIQRYPDDGLSFLVEIMEKFFFPYYSGIAAYYKNTCRQLSYLKPSIIVLFAESHESQLIVAMAAKKIGISTAISAHGLSFWGFQYNKLVRATLFQHCLAFGEKDLNDYIDQGVPRTRIHVSSFPYFVPLLKQSLRLKVMKHEQKKKALILIPDFAGTMPRYKIGDKYEVMAHIFDTMSKLDIEIYGIKGRYDFSCKFMGIQNDFIEHRGGKIRVYSGDGQLVEHLKEVDLVIGPPSTAIIEANIFGVDYYVYWKDIWHHGTHGIQTNFFKCMYNANNAEELEVMIKEGLSYRPGHTVNDLVNLNFTAPVELYKIFSNSISAALHSRLL